MKKKVRRITTLLLAVLMVVAMSSSVFAGSITKDDALKIAMKNAKVTKSQIRNIELEYEKAKGKYEVEFTKKENKTEYSYEIKKSNGKILEKSVDYVVKRNTSKDKIGKTAAINKVAKFSGIKKSVIKKGTCKYVRDDGQGVYKIKFKHNGRRYDYEVLAPNGKILEYEWELINK